MPQFQRRRTSSHDTSEAADKNQLWPVPEARGNATIDLADLVGADEVEAIHATGKMQFQAVGDTGVGIDSEQPEVAEALARDLDPAAPQKGPAFFLNLG